MPEKRVKKSYRLFVLGAGFSCSAGFPLGPELMRLVLDAASSLYGSDNKIEADLRDFLMYKERCDGVHLDRSTVDLEEFVSFLDIEHALGLLGSDTLSAEGNGSQVFIRRLIGVELQSRMPENPSSFPAVYHDFVSQLGPGDTVISFNYDLILETLLEYHGKAYRLFPQRYSEVGVTSCSSVENDSDVVILKLHGSIDWFSKRNYEERREVLEASGLDPDSARSFVFGRHARHRASPLVDGPRPENEDLGHIYRLEDPTSFYRDDGWEPPFLLTPSYSKTLYASPLKALWHGLAQKGGFNFGLGIVGFSMPQHDNHLRQVLYRIVRNYQHFEPNLEIAGQKKTRMAVVDFRPTPDSVAQLKSRYSFVDWSRTALKVDGFTSATLKSLFPDTTS